MQPHGRLDASRTKMALLGVAAILAVAVAIACWRYVPGVCAWLLDASDVRAFVADHAIASRLVLFGINVVQILLAFLPGEPVELASGYAFGFWEGTGLCLLASALATSLIYTGVRRWGWKLVRLFFRAAELERFEWLKDTKRLELVMLMIFLIPGTPKDFLTYFAGLTRMRFSAVLLITTVGRIPSIVTSTMAASAFGDGDYVLAIAAFVGAAALLVLGIALWRMLEARGRRV